jgi:hypothetical protein
MRQKQKTIVPGTIAHLRQRYDNGEELTTPELNELASHYGPWIWSLYREEAELKKFGTLDPDYEREPWEEEDDRITVGQFIECLSGNPNMNMI